MATFKIGEIVRDKETKIEYEVLGENVIDGIHLHPIKGGHHVWLPKSWIEKVEI